MRSIIISEKLKDSEVFKILERKSDESSVIVINIVCTQITKFPSNLYRFSNLHVLLLRDNFISVIPPEIRNFQHLEKLSIANNRLTKLPAELFDLTNLELLWLEGNQLKSIGPKLSNLKKLKSLDLQGNNELLPVKRRIFCTPQSVKVQEFVNDVLMEKEAVHAWYKVAVAYNNGCIRVNRDIRKVVGKIIRDNWI